MRRLRIVFTLALVLGAGGGLFAQGKAAKTRGPVQGAIGKLAISGKPTSVVHCTQGEAYGTHALGSAPAGTRFVIDIEGSGEEDLMATAVVVQMGAATPDGGARLTYQFNDDASATTFDPHLNFALEHTASVVLQVGTWDGQPGCYMVKVDISLPQ